MFLILVALILNGLTFTPSVQALNLRHSRASLLDLIDPDQSTATWQSLAAEVGRTEFRDGLLVIGADQQHEVASARRFARALQRVHGYKLVLLSKHAGIAIPAFDGLVLNARNEVLANFSLKSTVMRYSFRPSTDKIVYYGSIQNWVKHLINPIDDDTKLLYFSSTEEKTAFEKRVKRIRDLGRVFGVNRAQPTWMLIEYHAELPRAAEVIAGKVSWSARVPRGYLLGVETLYELAPETARPFALAPCERLITSTAVAAELAL